MSALTEGWVGVWPTLTMVGAFVMIPGGILALLGAVAGLVDNERLCWPLTFAGSAAVYVGAVMVFVGLGGWWTILAVAALVGFGWAVRPARSGAGR